MGHEGYSQAPRFSFHDAYPQQQRRQPQPARIKLALEGMSRLRSHRIMRPPWREVIGFIASYSLILLVATVVVVVILNCYRPVFGSQVHRTIFLSLLTPLLTQAFTPFTLPATAPVAAQSSSYQRKFEISRFSVFFLHSTLQRKNII